jgi:hypothetical protein
MFNFLIYMNNYILLSRTKFNLTVVYKAELKKLAQVVKLNSSNHRFLQSLNYAF